MLAQLERMGVHRFEGRIFLEDTRRRAAVVQKIIHPSGVAKKRRVTGCIAGVNQVFLFLIEAKMKSQGRSTVRDFKRRTMDGVSQFEVLARIEANEFDPGLDFFLS